MNLWRSIDLLYGATTEDYLNELADSTERGQEIPLDLIDGNCN